jgi:hypothetical protein
VSKIYWVGNRESEIASLENFFDGSITFFGEKKNNRHFIQKNNRDYNYNKFTIKADQFFIREIKKILVKDPGAQFYFYNHKQFNTCLRLWPDLSKYSVCTLPYDIVNISNNKFAMFDLVGAGVPCLPRVYTLGKYHDYRSLAKKFDVDKLVLQLASGSGGFGTYLLTAENGTKIKNGLEPETKYSVTPYQDLSVSVNLHAIIHDNGATIYPGSVQYIKNVDNQLCYRGADFISYRKIKKQIRDKIRIFTLEICDRLREIGYRGVFGADFIIAGDEIYFMEVNGRFQNSTTILNLALAENSLPSVQEQNLLAFQHKPATNKYENLKVNYSNIVKYLGEKYIKHPEPDIIYADGYDEKQEYSGHTYLYNAIFRQQIL